MIRVNGSSVSWLRYEFATQEPNGNIWAWPCYEDAVAHCQKTRGAVLKMRTIYATGWGDTL